MWHLHKSGVRGWYCCQENIAQDSKLMVFVPINDHAQKIEQWSHYDVTIEAKNHAEVVRDQDAMMARGFPFKHM